MTDKKFTIEYLYEKMPSWKAYGKGHGYIELNLHPKLGCLSIHCKEMGEVSVKETFTELPRELVFKLRDLINLYENSTDNI